MNEVVMSNVKNFFMTTAILTNAVAPFFIHFRLFRGTIAEKISS